MRQTSWSNGVTPHMSRSRKGAGSKESSDLGWVAAVQSPLTAPCGAETSRTGRIGFPSRRSSTKISPCLVGMHQRRHRVAVDGEIDERRLRGNVVVPQVVVHRPIGPAHATRWRFPEPPRRTSGARPLRIDPRPTGPAAGFPWERRRGPTLRRHSGSTMCWVSWACRSRRVETGSVSSGFAGGPQFHTRAPVEMS